MPQSFRRPARFLVYVLILVIAVSVVRRLLAGRRGPAPKVPHPPVHLPDTTRGADIEVETVRGEHVVGGVETADVEPAGIQTADVEAEEAPVPLWVAPEGDACPASHPVKVKLASGIYHVPGGINYDRTKPDRCYLSAAAAQNDGYRASKR